MGLLRFLLALAVVGTHTRGLSPFNMIHGFYAVETFFIISGFYMALILKEKYFHKKNSYTLFITNRILRLYPLYLIVLLLSLIIYMMLAPIAPKGNPWYAYTAFVHQTWPLFIYSIFSNLFIVGMDAGYFMRDYAHIHHGYLFVPQAWSISLEFMFYFLAPLLLRIKTRNLAALFFLSIGIRIYFIHLGFYDDPWSFRFLPTEFVFFLLGIFSYNIYSKIKSLTIPKAIPAFLFLLMACPILFWPQCYSMLMNVHPIFSQPEHFNLFLILYFAIILIGLPFIFLQTKNNTFDRTIGELSYPIYIVHFTANYALDTLNPTLQNNPSYGWIASLLSILIALILLRIVIYPLERFREGRVLSHKV